jgi:hypothetical protein
MLLCSLDGRLLTDSRQDPLEPMPMSGSQESSSRLILVTTIENGSYALRIGFGEGGWGLSIPDSKCLSLSATRTVWREEITITNSYPEPIFLDPEKKTSMIIFWS